MVDESLKYIALSGNNAIIQNIKVARALRPLRILTRFEALKFLGRITGGALGMIMRAACFSCIILFGFGKIAPKPNSVTSFGEFDDNLLSQAFWGNSCSWER